VLRRQPNDRNACMMLAEELLALEHYDEAAGKFRKASELAPENPKAWYGLGQSYKALSEAAYSRLETTAPDSPYAMALAADVFVQQRRYGDAFASYHRAQTLAPGFPGIHGALAEVYRRTGHAQWADVERGRERSVPAPDCQTGGMACDFLAGRYREVVEAAGRTPAPEELYWASKAYSGLARAAFAHLEQLPPSRESHIHAAQTHEKLGEYREAADEWREALHLAPGDFDAERGLAWALYRSRDCERALPVLTDLLKARPDSSELNFLYGANLLILQRPEQAVSYLQTAVRLDPQFLPGRAAVGQALLLMGRAKDAIPHLKAALNDDEDASVRFQLFRAYQLTGQADLAREALADYQRAREAAVQAKRMAEAGGITAP
jgi:predicted Zn-dependent protease